MLFITFALAVDNSSEESEIPVTTTTAVTVEVIETETMPIETEDSSTLGQKNALRQAESYLDWMSFSYSGLIHQLEYEGYTTEEATYAVDNCGADWFEQAANSAESYLEYSAFSREGLADQLEYEGFTEEQIEYALEQCGY